MFYIHILQNKNNDSPREKLRRFLSLKNFGGQAGFGLVEVVIGSAIISLALLGVISVASNSLRVADHSLREAQAGYLLLEGGEALRSMRDISWTNINGLSTTTTYYLAFSTTTNRFATTSANSFVDGIFERSFTTSDVFRNGSDNITASGTYDSGTRKIRMNVSWRERGATTTTLTDFYLTNI
ncbi:MAG: hypothetical protein AAB507_00885 [Patescibacteria group bacterium]